MAARPEGPRYLLGVDAGQTAVKAVVHDEQLRPVGIGRRSSPVDRSTPRFAERPQEALWQAAASAIREAVESSGVDPAQIVAVGITGHGDGLHLVDAAGAPVGPAITAMDSRAHLEAASLAADHSRMRVVLERSGQEPTPGAAGNLLRWLLVHDPARVEAAAAMLFCKDVIRLRLTGVVATDYSDATASFLDTATAEWSPAILSAYGLPESLMRLLPPVHASGDVVGTVLPAAAELTGLAVGTPVIAGMHDVQAASIGMGALVPGRLALVAGSFSTNGVTTTRPDVDVRWQSRLSIRPELRIAMSTSATASPALNWVLRLLGVDLAAPGGEEARDRLFAEAAALDPEESVPLVLPFLFDSPLGATASAALAGVRGWHTPAHVLRGTLEGIALMHVWHTRALGEKFDWDEPVVLGGGIARAPLYVQLVANALRSPVTVVQNEEAGAFGAAAVAGVSVGVFASVEEAQELVTRAEPVLPTAASAGYWAGVIAAFDEAVAALGPWWAARAGAAGAAEAAGAAGGAAAGAPVVSVDGHPAAVRGEGAGA
ncbi:carbohydrate kinase [Herbiconiux sp. VKM Ac-1786]|uniref:FGGY-family carbohydrate kinase n=1 Tax=Herbiconiux sp. VKM Ac-1786 TaxID=2783824 RepID=UPI00188D68C8|nr:FGGY-family carbohydrate kinase [Herbiconiux sp. VKM Ac-1786]MBF4573082.1 carbohydrate kinase [Herbiconiux sp. VKM Ac-1786]